MHIEEQDSLEVFYYLGYEQERGMEWMLYNDDKTGVTSATVLCFATQPEMTGFQKQYPAFAGEFKQAPIVSVMDAMEEIVKHGDDLVPANIELKVTPDGAIVINQQKTNVMNNENVDFLHNQIKYAGFGEDLHGALVKEIKAGNEEFKLQHSHTFGKDNVESMLNFKKSKESDMYFFNSYDVSMKKEGAKDVNNTFYINQGQSITLKEAYNLMNGRAVEKELLRKLSPEEKLQHKAEMDLPREKRGLPENWEKAPTYKAWIKLDLALRDNNGNFIQKQFHENFGFKVENALAKLPLRKLDASAMHDLVSSLKKGNIAQAGFTNDGNDKKMYLAADPQFKAIIVYDADMKIAKKETYSQNTKKEQEQAPQQKEQTNGVQQETAQAPAAGADKKTDLVAGPEAPWEGKKTDVVQQPAEEKKTEVGQGQGKEEKPEIKNDKAVTKSDLLPKNKQGNGLIDKKQKEGEGRKMKVA